jgi:hypothetical protein
MTLENNPMVNEALKQGAVPDGYAPVAIDFVQFKKPGDTLTGRLIIKTNIRIRGTPVGKYTIQTITGGQVKDVSFLGSVHLDELLSRIPVGKDIKVTFTHEEPIEGGNVMKRFAVFTKNQ